MTAALTSPAFAEPLHSALVRPGPALPNAGTATLTYYGGPIIQNVKVVTVFWGSGVQFSGSGTQSLNAFYTSVIQSAYYDWLGLDYVTTSPAQKIGRGTFGGSYNYAGDGTTSLQDSDVQTALATMIDGGKVPKPDANTYYAIHFAPGIDISNGGQGSCSVFCAYHSTFTHNGTNVMYGIIPDQGGNCAGGCGGDPSMFNNTTSVSSHELVEATTDPAIGLVQNSLGPPAGWYDSNKNDLNGGGEIGDICNAEQGTIGSYTVQKEWSNKLKSCIVTNPNVMVNDFSVAATPTTVTVPAGGMTTVMLALTKTVGSSETVQFSTKTPPADLTTSFMPTSAMSDMGKTTLTISAAATATVGSMETLTVQAAGMDATHSIDIPVMITMAPDMAMLPDLAQPSNNGGSGGNGGGGSGGNGNGTGGNGTGGNGNNGGGGGDSGCSMSGGSIAGSWAFAGLLLLALAFRRRRA